MSRMTIGWREWAGFPELELPHIKVKVDTGARTSALHAFAVESYEANGILMVRFGIHPLQNRTDIETYCTAPVFDQRVVSDSGGHKERRYVIVTPIRMGAEVWPIELTLTNRDTMRFRMLLGRTGLGHRFRIEPDASFLLGRPGSRVLHKIYGSPS